jgi:demethylmenaquinone methyltransferase / 2-methoxy-6-polyprenyl-1,4-benzoquinol methylase
MSSQIREMFDGLAPNYDRMNRVMTLGQDQRWRRFVVERAKLGPGSLVLDLASGTGDIAHELERRYPGIQVVAGDFSLGMLSQGMRRKCGERVAWVACDALALPFADASFDAVTFGYLLRNVLSIEDALGEVLRVLKPGGRVVCLDTMPPPPSLLRPFMALYLKHGLPILGRLLAGGGQAYRYLSDSTLAFKDPDALAACFTRAGFVEVGFRTFMFRTIAVHWAEKPADQPPA